MTDSQLLASLQASLEFVGEEEAKQVRRWMKEIRRRMKDSR